MTVCQDDLRLKAPAHPHDVCTETRVEMTDVQLCTSRNTDTPPRANGIEEVKTLACLSSTTQTVCRNFKRAHSDFQVSLDTWFAGTSATFSALCTFISCNFSAATQDCIANSRTSTCFRRPAPEFPTATLTNCFHTQLAVPSEPLLQHFNCCTAYGVP